MCLASQLVIIRASILIMYIFFISETVCRAQTDDQPPPQSTPIATPLQRYVTLMTLCALVSQSTTQLRKEKKASHQIH